MSKDKRKSLKLHVFDKYLRKIYKKHGFFLCTFLGNELCLPACHTGMS